MALVLNYLISFKKWYFYFIYLIGFWRKKCALRDKMCVCMSVFLCKVKNGNPFITSTTNFQLPSQLPYFPWRNHFVSGFLSLCPQADFSVPSSRPNIINIKGISFSTKQNLSFSIYNVFFPWLSGCFYQFIIFYFYNIWIQLFFSQFT